ncbi:undecaprenyl-diphosphate phosphatase [Kribbella sp. VKM Ac-2568]|uniref:undecaprenyl-diphosphate phosphatase n=1 Tax=Kribbella sp. VKM Ac-2568 TaxID=2512219 RepID=UPI0010497F8E|nr:undecaprenyl-diphosphate phosphatase [Kribbella sp. VKM Ac-2568]TCM42525.1 undecaprenyl-diphosphatase [Kribbella sp. VKM Ac-2568]
MTIWDAIILGIVEGLTEFLPVSSTGHLTIASKMLGQQIDDPAITAFTAVIQFGAIAAVVLFMWKEIRRYAVGWFRGLRKPEYRGEFDHRMGWFVIVGSLPICIVGFLAKGIIAGPLRSLWWVAGSLIVWSFFMVAAERLGSKSRPLEKLTLTDAIVMGLVQCLALIPGVSRSGATLVGGLFRGLDRVAATRMAFLLGIPALVGAAVFELPDALGGDVGLAPVLVGTLVSFIVGYASVAWLLRFVAKHSIEIFAFYRILLGVVILILLATSTITAT